MIEPFGVKSEFILRRIDPRTFSLKDALEIGELDLASFADTPHFLYMLSDKFNYKGDEKSVFEAEPHDSFKRVKLRRQRQQVYEDVSLFFAHKVLTSVVSSGYVGYELYTKDSTGNRQKLIGYCDFRYADYMIDSLDEELRPNTTKGVGWFRWTIYSTWLTVKFKIFNLYLNFKYWDNPVLNSRRKRLDDESRLAFEKEFPPDADKVDKLSLLSHDQLKDELYPQEKTFYTHMFCIHPDYWGAGLGTSLLSHCINLVPKGDTPFISKDKKNESYGPQKFALKSTDMGLHMYKKVGYTSVFTAIVNGINGEKLNDISMVYVRDWK